MFCQHHYFKTITHDWIYWCFAYEIPIHSVHITAVSPLSCISSGRKILILGFILLDFGLGHSFWKYAVIDKKLLIGMNLFPGMCLCVCDYVWQRAKVKWSTKKKCNTKGFKGLKVWKYWEESKSVRDVWTSASARGKQEQDFEWVRLKVLECSQA